MTIDCWIPIGLASQIQPASSNPVVVEGRSIAVWRGDDGPVSVWEDRCPHRGMPLSMGFVRGNTLHCIYHGWGYASDGHCTNIPAHPDLQPPKTICANSYPSRSRYGIVWTNFSEDQLAPLPDVGTEDGWTSIRSIYVSGSAEKSSEDILKLNFGAKAEAKIAGKNAVSVQVGPDLELLLGIQPIDGVKTGVHVVAKGSAVATAAGRLKLALELENRRNEMEAS